ncbi:hypothetical protein EVAR_17415_1 [Eumeta japonica]|uniref:Uncharacterized protein n=1 Tax=Eumeta variegata TaxID=151549 RepID=A0A4C1VC77_EUMVA|nr:hypothetical protein EVAR_17415_1 [Eumeta japonica]
MLSLQQNNEKLKPTKHKPGSCRASRNEGKKILGKYITPQTATLDLFKSSVVQSRCNRVSTPTRSRARGGRHIVTPRPRWVRAPAPQHHDLDLARRPSARMAILDGVRVINFFTPISEQAFVYIKRTYHKNDSGG